MEKRDKDKKSILLLSFIGIAGALLTIVSDFILIGRPAVGWAFFKMGTEGMAELAQWRITFGAFFGIVVLPMQIAGIWTLLKGLRPGGKVLPIAVAVTYIHALIMGVAFHVSYAYCGTAWKLYYRAGDGVSFMSGMMDSFYFFWKLLIIIMVAEIIIASVIYAGLVLSGRTLFKKWMALVNPLTILAVLYPTMGMIPAPLGGFIATTYMNMTTLIFMIFVTLSVYRNHN